MDGIMNNESERNDGDTIAKLPKNIRQIGSPKGRHKIYIEDYVYTFLHSTVFGKENRRRAAVLLGRSEIQEEVRTTFISGAVNCGEYIFQNEEIIFDENCWEHIYKEMRQYFEQQEIIGWYIEATGFSAEMSNVTENVHRKYFSGPDKILFLSDFSEGEEQIFTCEQGNFRKKEGYYIYYEKNPAMQEYMISARERVRERVFSRGTILSKGENNPLADGEFTISPEGNLLSQPEPKTATDQAISDYRTMFCEKKEVSSQRKSSMLLYTSAAAAMIVLCVIGITTMNNYDKMKEVEEALSIIVQFGQQNVIDETGDNVEIPVQTIPGGIEPQDNLQNQGTQEPVEGITEQPVEDITEQPPTDIPEQPTDTTVPQPPAESTDVPAVADGISQEAREYLQQGYYIVQPGDKLELICKMLYQTTDLMDELCRKNQIEDIDKIYVGQKLILP